MQVTQSHWTIAEETGQNDLWDKWYEIDNTTRWFNLNWPHHKL